MQFRPRLTKCFADLASLRFLGWLGARYRPFDDRHGKYASALKGIWLHPKSTMLGDLGVVVKDRYGRLAAAGLRTPECLLWVESGH